MARLKVRPQPAFFQKVTPDSLGEEGNVELDGCILYSFSAIFTKEFFFLFYV